MARPGQAYPVISTCQGRITTNLCTYLYLLRRLRNGFVDGCAAQRSCSHDANENCEEYEGSHDEPEGDQMSSVKEDDQSEELIAQVMYQGK
jgi:hypothetical protein